MKKIIATVALTASLLAGAGAAHADVDTMPDVRGKGLTEAYQALDYDTSIKLKDGRGAGRHVLWPSGWKVCNQTPKPGAAKADNSIELTVVKRDEKCP